MNGATSELIVSIMRTQKYCMPDGISVGMRKNDSFFLHYAQTAPVLRLLELHSDRRI